MQSRIRIIAALGAILLIAGCNSNSTNPMETLNPGSMAVDLQDGSEFLSASAKVSDQSNVYILSATQDVQGAPSNEITLSIPKELSLPFTVQSQPDGAIITYYDITNNNTYEANPAQGYCTITVTQTSPTFEGTFSGTLKCSTAADSVRVFSNGAFNATFQ